MQLYTIDFESIYQDQSWIQSTQNVCMKLKDLPLHGINGFCSEESQEILLNHCSHIQTPSLVFSGSGNYHYLSLFLLNRIKTPFSLILFDHHSDMQIGPSNDMLSCGNWVDFVLRENPYLKQLFIIGISKQYVPKNYGDFGKEIFFFTDEEVKKRGWLEQLNSAIQFPLYISIDKDVFSQEFVHTNWDQGSMNQQEIQMFFEKVALKHQMIGGDICGECSKDFINPDYYIDQQLNGKMNEYLMDCFQSYSQKLIQHH